jgi:hypothetical protein
MMVPLVVSITLVSCALLVVVGQVIRALDDERAPLATLLLLILLTAAVIAASTAATEAGGYW